MFDSLADARVSASKSNEQRTQNQQRILKGISYGVLWKFRAFAQQLQMLFRLPEMPSEKKDKGKTRSNFPFILTCLNWIFY